jgi:glycosyltransferase involved in cell wall biosynthesis
MPSPSPRHLLVEGWRFLPHSYAIVNQYQLLGLLDAPAPAGPLEIFHRDVPFVRPHWRPVAGLFPAADEKRLAALPPPPPDLVPDAVLRMAFPYDLSPAAARLCVFATAESSHVPKERFLGGRTLCDLSDELRLVTPSHWSRQGFLRNGADPAHVLVVPHGADPALFHPLPEAERAALRAQLGWDGFVFLSIGAMTPNKGIDLLLHAFVRLAETFPDARLVLKGLDALYPSRDLLLGQCQRLSPAEAALLQPRLLYLSDNLTFAEMARLYQAADAYVCPYLAEGFNLPALEAVACGLLTICTAGGPTDDFTDDGCSLRVNSRREPFSPAPGAGVIGERLRPDIEHLLHQMRVALMSPDLLARARVAGPALCRGRFTWEHAAAGLLRALFC